MMSFRKIWAVALYETKTLIRSKLFVIFVIFALVSSFIITLILNSLWIRRGIPAFIPYTILLPLNLLQTIVVIIIAFRFLAEEREQNTIDAVYSHSFTNAEYIFGKFLGVLVVFVSFDMLYLGGALIIDVVFFRDVPVFFRGYLYYLLLLPVPTLVFITGLSFVSMALIRSKAIT